MRWMMALTLVVLLAGCSKGDDTPKFVAQADEVPSGWTLADMDDENVSAYFEAAGMKQNPGYADVGVAQDYVGIERAYAAVYVGPEGHYLISGATKFENQQELEMLVQEFKENCEAGAALQKGTFLALVAVEGHPEAAAIAKQVGAAIAERTGATDVCS